jgi:diguanylate cyclase (GGDEF)-like protein
VANIDELSGISNRGGFIMLANKSLKYSARRYLNSSLVYLDIKKYKAINDNNGHAEGDKAIIAIADLMTKLFRGSDVFTCIGGDQFAVFLSDTNKEGPESLIRRFQAELEYYNSTAGNHSEISFSYCVIEYDRFKHTSIDLLMADGDKLMCWKKDKTAVGNLNGDSSRSL